MRHRSKTVKLKRTADHRRALLANLACSLIEHGRIRTTLAKAKALRPVAEKLVTLGKRGDLHARRQAVAFLRHKDVAKKLFEEVAPLAAKREGGYCRITKLGARMTDAAPMAVIEWVDQSAEAPAEDVAPVEAKVAEAPAKKSKAKKAEDEAPVEVEAEEAPAKKPKAKKKADEPAEDAPAQEEAEAAEDKE
ncbi:50S ribosomal protein L17 [Haloferula sargassicola]|uniref:Large ribosomal subunit protein bL17 n=1 Tax=Haloferula sargassicola TaxID=490096 RepID=A0ABP9UR76_9BACT